MSSYPKYTNYRTGPNPETPKERAEKIAALKSAIQNGTYEIQTEDIILNVLKEFIVPAS